MKYQFQHLIILFVTLIFATTSDSKAQDVESLIPIRLDGKWGYIDTTGKMVIEPQYDVLPGTETESDFDDFPFMVHRQEEDYGDTTDLETIFENNKYGFADKKTGKIVIKPQFDEVGVFHNGFSVVKINTRDTIKEEYDPAYDMMPIYDTPIDSYISSDGHTIYVYNRGFYVKCGYVSDKGVIAIEPQFEEAGWFSSNGFANVKKDGKWGIINTHGKFVVAPDYDKIISNTDNYELISVRQDGKSKLINLKGETIADLESEPRDLKEMIESGLPLLVRENAFPIPIKKDENKFDFIDIKGKTVFSGEFDYVWLFYNGIAKIMKKDKWGLIDSTGKVIAEPRYDKFESIIGCDFYISKLGDKYGVVDIKGNVVAEPKFLKVFDHVEEDNFIKVFDKDGCGLIDAEGKMIIEPKFYNIKVKGNRIFVVAYVDGFKVGMYNLQGECIVAPKYDGVYNNYFFD